MSAILFDLAMQMVIVVAQIAIVSGVVLYACLQSSNRYLHVLQLNSYQIDGYHRSMRRNANADLWPGYAIFAAAVTTSAATSYLLASGSPFVCLLGVLVAPIVFIALSAFLAKRHNAQKQKKPLVFTERLLRLRKTHAYVCLFSALLASILGAIALYMLLPVSLPLAAFVCAMIGYAPYALTANLVALSAKLREKPEAKVNQSFIDDAKRILKGRKDLICIGITGSYGKTSTKFILGTILAEKYKVLVPPSSYNTPMGITRMVREMLDDSHQVLIAEMGARHVHEIAELCNIVHPNYSLLTSIGKQHLETFGSFENIIKTKYEIMQALDEKGVGFFPNDDGVCLKLFEGFTGNKRLFGLQASGNDVWAEDIELGPLGSTFTLRSDTDTTKCTTGLLGRHNIMNILGCAAVAHELGLTLPEIAAGIAKVEPIEHRLQLINPGNGVLIIDDAFNSNPQGTQMAMDVLSMFTGYRKICVTPGMVELGESEYEENRKFGNHMAQVCDIVILVGEQRAKAMVQGLSEGGFPPERMHVVSDLDKATAVLAELTRAGDVVLFENDLPDHYVS